MRFSTWATWVTWGLALLVAGTLGAGCEEDAQPEYLFPSAWRSAGLSVSSFPEMSEHSFAPAKCWSGDVADIETIVCRYGSKDEAKKGRELGLKHVGGHTGTSLSSGVWLLTIVDRENQDPTGKNINLIAKTFLDHGEVKPKEESGEPKGDKDGEKDGEKGGDKDGDEDEKSKSGDKK